MNEYVKVTIEECDEDGVQVTTRTGEILADALYYSLVGHQCLVPGYMLELLANTAESIAERSDVADETASSKEAAAFVAAAIAWCQTLRERRRKSE